MSSLNPLAMEVSLFRCAPGITRPQICIKSRHPLTLDGIQDNHPNDRSRVKHRGEGHFQPEVCIPHPKAPKIPSHFWQNRHSHHINHCHLMKFDEKRHLNNVKWYIQEAFELFHGSASGLLQISAHLLHRSSACPSQRWRWGFYILWLESRSGHIWHAARPQWGNQNGWKPCNSAEDFDGIPRDSKWFHWITIKTTMNYHHCHKCVL